MCTGAPSAPPPPARAPEAPRLPDAGAPRAGDTEARRRRAAAGTSSTSTILTGARGVQDGAATATKTLLGQ
jgi:hypothetical protein